jgi:phage terminase large subunit
MTTRVRLPNQWRPRPHQKPLWTYLERGGRRAVEVAHRRWGKDDVALHWTAVASQERVGTYWHMLPEAAQARKAVWEAVNPHTGKRRIDEAFPRELRATTREQEMFIRFKNGSTWQVVGSDNFNSLVGSPPIGLVLSEYALANPAAWSYLRPILLENGGWALFIYTPRGNNHGKALLDSAKESAGWFADISPVSLTKAIPKEALDEELREMMRENGADQGKALFRQEWECSFDAAIIGAYYVGEMDAAEEGGRIRNVPYDPALPVNTYWDIGIDDATAVWFEQQLGAEIRMIEYQEWTQQPLTAIAGEVAAKGYVYGEHVFPHDIRAREMTTGRTREEVMKALLGRGVVVAPMQLIADGINAVRTILPKMWFDRVKCAKGLDAMRNYRKRYDEKRRTFEEHPHHDWASHGADAMRQKGTTHRDRMIDRNERRERYGKAGRRKASAWAA